MINNLEYLSANLTPDQQMSVIEILKTADIARCIKNTTIQKELKLIRKRIRGGKIKRRLSFAGHSVSRFSSLADALVFGL